VWTQIIAEKPIIKKIIADFNKNRRIVEFVKMANFSKVSIVFDIGSSSVRAAGFELHPDIPSQNPVLIDGSLQQQQCSLNDRGEGDPFVIKKHLENCLDKCLESIATYMGPTSFSVERIGFTTFAMSWMGVDVNGDPVTPLYTYARRGDNSDVSVNSLR
jgi:sugar (pentulose or hexulose) kinase